jgi:hypothetical protein
MPTNAVNTTSQNPYTPIQDTALDRTIMFASCVLERGRFSWVWVVPACPYCNKAHDHYAGPLDGDPYIYVGRMFTARCDATERQRLLPEYPSLNLLYVLEPIQSREQVRQPLTARMVGGK